MKIKISPPWIKGKNQVHFRGCLSACKFEISKQDLEQRIEPIIVETDDLTMLSHMRNYGANAESVNEKKNTFDIRIKSPWPADLTELSILISGYGNKINLAEAPAVVLKGVNKYTIEQLQDMGVRYEVLPEVASDDHISNHESTPNKNLFLKGPWPLNKLTKFVAWLNKKGHSITEADMQAKDSIVVNDVPDKDIMWLMMMRVEFDDITVYPEMADTINAIIQTPFPFDVTAQGKRFWEIMGYYTKNPDTQASYHPIVIFNMLYVHYEELRKTSALISEYSPVEDGCVVPEPAKTPSQKFSYKVGKLTIHVTNEFPEATEKSSLISALMCLGCTNDQATDIVYLKYTSPDQMILNGLNKTFEFCELSSVFHYEGEYNLKI